MANTDKITEHYSEAVEAMDTSVDTDIESQQRTQREQLLKNWDEEKARKLASEEEVILSHEHFKVIHLLRDIYLEKGPCENGRELDELLDDEFANQGGRKYLHQLFPGGPVTQGMRFAGLPVPAHTEDESFGTAR